MDDKEFSSMLEKSVEMRNRQLNPGDELTGRVVGESAEDFFVDYGGKSEALLPKDEAEEGTATGSVVRVRVRRISPDGTIYLAGRISRQSVDKSAIRMAYESGMPVQGRVLESRKGGYSVELGPKIRAFCPISQIDDQFTSDPLVHMDKTYWFKILEFSDTGDIVVSRRAYLRDEKEKKKEELLKTLQPGQVLEGTVSRIMDYGAFVDIGGIEGLLHVSQISWDQVNPHEVLEEGQKVRVKVTDMEHRGDTLRISLSMKVLEKDPWETFGELEEGAILEGEVMRIKPFGAFIRLAPGVEGLLHISEMAWHRVSRVEDLLSVGDRVKVKVLSADPDSKRISLSLREVQGAPEGEIAEGAQVDGIVNEVKSFGLLVTLPGGKVGLLPKRERGAVNPANAFKEGQPIRVLVMSVDEENGRISLTTADKKDLMDDQDYRKFAPKKEDKLATLGDFLADLKKDR